MASRSCAVWRALGLLAARVVVGGVIVAAATTAQGQPASPMLSPAQLETLVRRAMAQCEASPASPIAQAFQRALVPRRAGQAPRS